MIFRAKLLQWSDLYKQFSRQTHAVCLKSFDEVVVAQCLKDYSSESGFEEPLPPRPSFARAYIPLDVHTNFAMLEDADETMWK